MMKIDDLLKYTVSKGASDLHVLVGSPPMMRIQGKLSPIDGEVELDAGAVETLLLSFLSAEQKEKLLAEKEIDLSMEIAGTSRFRVNVYTQKETLAADFRVISDRIPTIDELGLPRICHTFAGLRQGFILIVGPTGHGKSTTLAAIIEEINKTRDTHVVTIEDPVEFVYHNKKSIISQREMGSDTRNWDIALRSVLRQDPDVVLIGEMRDADTMAAAITIAETGHLVFATLHTNSAAQTIDRIIDSFPEEQQKQVRVQLSASLEAILSQRLVPSKLEGKRVLVTEVLVATPAVRNIIRESKSHQIDNVILTSSEMGMYLLENSLAELVNRGVIDSEVARNYAIRPTVLEKLLGI